jgi:hypothetical protein
MTSTEETKQVIKILPYIDFLLSNLSNLFAKKIVKLTNYFLPLNS